MFANKKGESLALTDIIGKKVTSVTIAYLSKKREVRAKGIRGFFGYKELKQDPKELTITDPNGIRIFFSPGIYSTVIRFSEKKEFKKLSDDDFDSSTILKRYIMTMVQPYEINFHIFNLRRVDWE